jgi:endonuclease/exonuclease/phosphatase family metal-dependent hydrolase
MPRYYQISTYPDDLRKRILEKCLNLRQALDKKVPKVRPDSFLLATWNIRDFDSNKFGHGPRLQESFHYLAEIISRFDLVALQEITRDLKPLVKLIYLLGPEWDYIVTGVTEGSGGNDERMAFVYNRNRVKFTNLAGQVVLPKNKLISDDGLQFARMPYVASFQAGWFKFNLCTVHIYFGDDSGPELERRITEIQGIAQYFKRLNEREVGDYILLGDFNIMSPEHKTMQALVKNGFKVPPSLQNFKTNLSRDKYYDQIAFQSHDKRLEFGEAGVFDFREGVFGEQDFETYFDMMPANLRDFQTKGKNKGKPLSDAEKRDYYNKEWITWQMSDHLLLWTELKNDFTNDYLTSLLPGKTPNADPR